MTRTLKFCHVHLFGHNTSLSRSLVSNPITISDFSLKPGTLLWTRTLGTITSYYQKPTKASREHELRGHARKLCVTLVEIMTTNFVFIVTDEGLSISRNVCCKISRVSGELMTSPDYTFSIFKLSNLLSCKLKRKNPSEQFRVFSGQKLNFTCRLDLKPRSD